MGGSFSRSQVGGHIGRGGGTQAHRMIKYLPVVVGWLVGGWVSLLGLWEEYILAYVYFMFLWWWWVGGMGADSCMFMIRVCGGGGRLPPLHPPLRPIAP